MGLFTKKLLRLLWSSGPALFVVFLIAVLLVMSSGVKSKSERLKAEKAAAVKKQRPAINVVLLEVKPAPIRDRLDLPGVVEPDVELEIFAEVPGKAIDVKVKEGDKIKTGDVIAVIDDRDYRNSFNSARADYELAQKNLERVEDLRKENLVNESDYDGAKARVESARSVMENARLALERCTIEAPRDGIINRLDVKKGLLLKAYDPVAVILDINPVKVKVGIPESDVDEVGRLQSFEIKIDALNGKKIRGTKRFLSKTPQTMAHLYALEIDVENPSGEILPGMFAKVEIIKKETNAVSVPIYAVIKRDEEQHVFVEKDGLARSRTVKTGILEGWMLQITEGLKEGDRVVVVGHRSLSEGQEVNVIRTVTDPVELFK